MSLCFGAISEMSALAVPAGVACLGISIMSLASFRAHRSILRVGWDLVFVTLSVLAGIFVISNFVGQSNAIPIH